ncbi:MAG: hypothetical protein RIT02_1248 [Planctomycetota bacterium]
MKTIGDVAGNCKESVNIRSMDANKRGAARCAVPLSEPPAFPSRRYSKPAAANPGSPGIPARLYFKHPNPGSLGLSPGANFSSSLKSPVFFGDGAEQECSGYLLSLASGMPGLKPCHDPRNGVLSMAFRRCIAGES